MIGEAIRGAGGWIPFDRYMELALYTPGLGYYAAGARKFGDSAAGGDFVTAPEISPLFAAAVVNQVAQVFAYTPARIVALISREMTLHPGDVIACGTSVGALPMRPGMQVEVTIEGIGTLSNPYAP